jgi:hypothetical protein
MTEKPIVFISCGQSTDAERELGNAVEGFFRDQTDYEPYFAEQQNTLEGLVANILAALERSSALVAIMHHRGTVSTPGGDLVRGSVWVEQEIAIASFLENVVGRQTEVVLYQQPGIALEGIRQQLRLKPIEFTNPDEVLADLAIRVKSWTLTRVANYSLIAIHRYKITDIAGSTHRYKLNVDLFNNGSSKVEDWSVQLEFPTVYLLEPRTTAFHKVYMDNDTKHTKASSRIYPTKTKPVFNIDYFVDNSNHPARYREAGKPVPHLKISVMSGDMPPWEKEISMEDLQDY